MAQKFLWWKIFNKKNWIINHASGVGVSEGEWCSRELFHKEHREGRYKWLHSNWRARGSLCNEHKTHLKNTNTPHTKWTAQRCHMPCGQSLQRLKIKWTNPQEGKNNTGRHYKRQHLVRVCLNCTLPEAGGVFGRATAYSYAWISRLQRKGSCCTTLRKPKSPLWKGGLQGENPSDYVW